MALVKTNAQPVTRKPPAQSAAPAASAPKGGGARNSGGGNDPRNRNRHRGGGGGGGGHHGGGHGGGGPAGGAGPAAASPRTPALVAANDHAGYFGSMVSPQFAAYGQDNPFGQYLSSTALAKAEQGYTNNLYQNTQLQWDKYLSSLGAGARPGMLGAIGTGQAGMVDTGNPFTSASPAVGAPAKNVLGTRYTDAIRRNFLALSPTERGETAQGKTMMPGRWSPWG